MALADEPGWAATAATVYHVGQSEGVEPQILLVVSAWYRACASRWQWRAIYADPVAVSLLVQDTIAKPKMDALLLSTASLSYADIPLPEMVESPASDASSVHAREEEHPCTECGKQRSRRGSVAMSPTQKNAGRSYFPCTNSRCRKGSVSIRDRDFVTWDAHGENPRCDCGVPSQQGRTGREDRTPGYGFWACAVGGCKYYSRDRKGRSVARGEVAAKDVQPFIPWLLYAK